MKKLSLSEILEKLAGVIQIKIVPNQNSSNMGIIDFSNTVQDITRRLGLSLSSLGIAEDYELKRSGSSGWREYHVEFGNFSDATEFMDYINNGKSENLVMAGVSEVPIGYQRFEVIKQL